MSHTDINDLSNLYIILFMFIFFLMIWIIFLSKSSEKFNNSIITKMNDSKYNIKLAD